MKCIKVSVKKCMFSLNSKLVLQFFRVDLFILLLLYIEKFILHEYYSNLHLVFIFVGLSKLFVLVYYRLEVEHQNICFDTSLVAAIVVGGASGKCMKYVPN